MTELLWTIVIGSIACLWWAAFRANRSRIRRLDGSGDAADGIVIFVEPLRWLFIIWGFAPFCRGLRQAGGQQLVRLFRWSGRAGALLVLPDFLRRKRLLKKSARLAQFINDLASLHPGRAIHVVGYSSGCFVALEALRRVDAAARIGEVILLAGAVSPYYDVRDISVRVRAMHSFHSPLDFVISGLAPLLFGSNDGRWGPACGMVGMAAPGELVSQHAWSPSAIGTGYLGDHFTITSSAFIARHVAPLVAPTR